MQAGREEDVRAIVAQLDSFAALSGGVEDNEAYLAAFSDDAVILPPDRPALRGKRAMRAFYDEAFRAATSVRVIYRDPAVEIDGALAVRMYTASVRIILRGSNREEVMHIKYLDVLKKQVNGDWQISAHMWSSNEHPPKEPLPD
jgi:ketosteroid isomerase-like protein